MGESVHFMVVVNYFAVISLILSPFGILIFQEPFVLLQTEYPSWLFLGGVGVAAFLGQAGYSRSLQLETAARTTALSYIQIVFAFFGEIIVFHQVQNFR
jgi:drug/metabolite transporter (DMT)-like permease